MPKDERVAGVRAERLQLTAARRTRPTGTGTRRDGAMADDAQGDVERDRRLQGRSRTQHNAGAIDESESIDPESSDESE